MQIQLYRKQQFSLSLSNTDLSKHVTSLSSTYLLFCTFLYKLARDINNKLEN